MFYLCVEGEITSSKVSQDNPGKENAPKAKHMHFSIKKGWTSHCKQSIFCYMTWLVSHGKAMAFHINGLRLWCFSALPVSDLFRAVVC